jgi:hypothetical protein
VGDARVIEYEYDDLYRLVEADYRSTGLTTGTSGEYFAYAYDAEAAQAIRGGTNDTTDRETINAICRDLL